MIAADLIRRGYRIALPYGEDSDFDLILCREDPLERIQCKYSESNGVYVTVRCCSASLTNGKVRAIKRYTAATIDWLAAYRPTTDRCY
jgi:PD-(D/E)XK endonuclease